MSDVRALRIRTIYEISQLVNLFEMASAHLCGVGDLGYHLSHLETDELMRLRSQLFRFITIIRDSSSPEEVVDGLVLYVRDQIAAIEKSYTINLVE